MLVLKEVGTVKYKSLLKKAMLYQYPEEISIFISFLPAVWKKYGAELQKLCACFPVLFGKKTARSEVF